MLDTVSSDSDAKDAHCVATGTDCPGKEAVMGVLKTNFEVFKNLCNIGIITSSSSLLSVISQFVFNLRSKYKVPFDKWSLLDLANSVVNTIVL
jgi:hypothetical protein